MLRMIRTILFYVNGGGLFQELFYHSQGLLNLCLVILLVLHYFKLISSLELLIVIVFLKGFYARSKVDVESLVSPCFVSLFGYSLFISLVLWHVCFVRLIEEDALFEEVSLMILTESYLGFRL